MSLPFRRVTAGLGGEAERVAGIAELAAWLLLVNGAPGRGRFCPSLKRLLAVGGLCWPCWVRVLRGRGLGLALLVGGGPPPRRRGCPLPVSFAPVCASALAVAAAARSTARRIHGSSAAVAAASAAARKAAAARFSAGLCCWMLEFLSGSGPAVAEVLAALAEWSLPLSLVRVFRLTVRLESGSQFIISA